MTPVLTEHSNITGPARLIALDVDGTLLTSHETVTERTRRALVAAEAAGWHVVIVTGRPLSVALPVVHDLALGEYVIAGNGGTIAHIHSGAVLFQASLPGAAVAEAIRISRREIPGLGVAVTTPRGFVREAGFGEVAPLSELEGERVLDATPHDDDSVQAAVLFKADIPAADILRRLARVLPAGMEVSASGLIGAVELTEPGINKATGIDRLCRLVSIAQRDVVAFGDGINDHEMLQWAGHGVAMGNALPETKARADEITASNDEDGIALVVERLLAGHY